MKLNRSISTLGMLCTSVGCMVGSGWLFGAYYASQIAGPAAIISWIIGGILIIFIALTFTELSTMLPVAGGVARYCQFSHGTMVSFCMSWLAWLSCVAVAPTEVQAMLQYAATYFPWIIHKEAGVALLTMPGIAVAGALMFITSILNIMGIKLLTRFNSLITLWKLIIPLIVIVVIFHMKFTPSNFTSHKFSPSGWHGILWALPTAGIIFSFLGFREATSMAGEAKLPGRSLPIAVIGSVVICIALYVLVQIVFIGAVPAKSLLHGWSHLSFVGDSGPFAGIAASLGLSSLVILIYVDAFASPLGTSLIYTTTTSRLNYAMAMNRYTPQYMLKLNRKGVPALAVMFNFVIGMFMFLPLPGWQALVGFQSSAIILAYGVGPIALLVLRKKAPELKRPFKLPATKIMCVITFYICNLVAYWTGWSTIWRLMVAVLIGIILLFTYRACSKHKYPLELKAATWLIPYFLCLMTVSYLGNFGGGLGVITFGWDFLVIAIYSSIIMWLAYASSLTKEKISMLLPDHKELDLIQ